MYGAAIPCTPSGHIEQLPGGSLIGLGPAVPSVPGAVSHASRLVQAQLESAVMKPSPAQRFGEILADLGRMPAERAVQAHEVQPGFTGR